MIFIRLFVLLCVLPVLSVTAGPLADYETWLPNGPVYAVADLKESTPFYHDGVLTYSPGTTGALVYALAGGQADYSWPEINGPVYAIVFDGAGGWYLGGDFSSIGGVARNNIAHLDSTGSVDVAWDPDANGPVRAMTLSGSTLYVGGEFRSEDGLAASIGNQPRDYLAALDADSLSGTYGQSLGWDPAPNGTVLALAEAANVLRVGGDFTVIDDQTRHRLAAIDVDSSSMTYGKALAWNPDVDARVHVIVIDGSQVFIAGGFTHVNVGTVNASLNFVAQVNDTDGAVNIGWDAGVDGVVRALAVDGMTNLLYLGGDFSHINGGLDQRYLAAVSTADGMPDTLWRPDLNAPVHVTHIAGGNQLYVGGVFSRIDDKQRHRLALFDLPGGALNTAWQPETLAPVTALGSSVTDLFAGGAFDEDGTAGRKVFVGGGFDYVGPRTGSGVAIDADPLSVDYSSVVSGWPEVDGTVYAAVADGAVPNGWYIGGDFSSVGGVARNNIAHLDSAGSVDMSWDPDADNPVRALALDSGGTTLYVGGNFTLIGGQPRDRLASLDADSMSGSYGQALTWNPGADGAVLTMALSSTDATLYVGGEFTTVSGGGTAYVSALDTAGIGNVAAGWAYGANATVHDLALSNLNDLTLYAGGDFTFIGNASRSRVAALDTSDGSALTTWDPGANGVVRAVELAGNDKSLYVGGDFSLAGGQPRSSLALLDTDTGSGTYGQALGWNPAPDGPVYSLALSGDDATLYVGGKFLSMASLNRGRLAAFATAGNSITGWNPAAGATVQALAESGDVVFAGGAFRSVGGVLRGNLAALDDDPDSATYGQALTWQSDTDGIVRSLRVAPDQSSLYVGGDFSTIGGQYRQRLARVNTVSGFVGSWDPGADASVRDMVFSESGVTLFIGGDFTSIGGENVSGLAEVSTQTGIVLTPRPDVDGSVYDLVRSGSSLYIAGLFNSLNGGAKLRRNLAAINLTDYTVRDWNPGANGLVRALAVTDNSLYAGGDFSVLGASDDARNYLGAVDLLTGDATTWAPLVNNRIHALELSADYTQLYTGGEFTSVNGMPRNRLTALHAVDGTLITDDGTGTDWDPDSDNTIHTIKRPADGNRLFAGGEFSQMAGQLRDHLSVLAPLALDSQSPSTSASPAGTSFNSINNTAITLDCDDGTGSGCRTTYYSINGGPFETYTEPVLLGKDTVLQFYSVDDLGNVESAINTEVYTVELQAPETTISPGFHVFDQKSLTITLSCSDDISGCAGTYYTLDDSQPTLSSRLYTGPFRITDSTVVKYFSVDIAGNREGFKRTSFISIYYGGRGAWGPWTLVMMAITLLWRLSSRLAISTGFAKYELLSVLVVLLVSQGTPSRADTLPQDSFPSTDGPVYSMLVQQGILYIGGDFTVVGSETRHGIAAVKLSDGTVVDDWDPGINLGGIVHAMAVSKNGCNLFIGGDFTGIGIEARTDLAAIGIKKSCAHYGEATTDWIPDITGNAVYALALSSDGTTLYVGGDFSGVNLTARSNLAALAVSDAALSPWNPGTDAPVRSLLLTADDSTLYAGGEFGVIGGELRSALAALSPTANQAKSWAPQVAGGAPAVMSLTLSNDGSLLYAGGDFSSVGATTRDNLAVFTTADGILGSWDAGTDGIVRVLRLSPNEDRLYAGGDFTMLGKSGSLAGRSYLGAVDTSSAEATDWSPVLDDRVRALATNGNSVYVAGDFINVQDSVPAAHQGVLAFPMVPPVTTPDVAAGAYQSNQDVTLACIDARTAPCVDTWYTDDGTDPVTSITAINGTGPISITSTIAITTIRFFSIDDEGTQEAVKSASYAIDNTEPDSSAEPDGSVMLNAATGGQVVLLCDDNGIAGCGAVYYTTDGSIPAEVPADLYAGPITLSEGDSTLSFFAVDLAGNSEADTVIHSIDYSVDRVLPVVTASHLSGTYTQAITVELSCEDFSGSGCNNIYYTLDGEPPVKNDVINTDSAVLYDALNPPVIATGTVLRVYATDMAGNGSAVANSPDQDTFVYIFTDSASKARQHTGAGGLDFMMLTVLLVFAGRGRCRRQ